MLAKGKKLRTSHSQSLSLPSQDIGLWTLYSVSFLVFLLCFPSPLSLYTGQKQRGVLICQDLEAL